MATTSIGNGDGRLVAADLNQTLMNDLVKELGAMGSAHGAKTASTDASQRVDGASTSLLQPPSGPTPATDVASVLLSEVATSDLTKLTNILQPGTDPVESQLLDSLLRSAIQEVANGNDGRAIGYLADYATRDPRRGEALPFEPALEPVRDKIDSMVNRMTVVAKMSAEDGLSRAEQTSSQLAGKISNWDTHVDVLLKLAQSLFASGGYANYSKTAELARLVSGAADTKPAGAHAHAFAASASASGIQTAADANAIVPGLNVPYWASTDVPVVRPGDVKSKLMLRTPPGPMDDVGRNFKDLKEISAYALRQIWQRAPLLVMMLVWFAVGLAGGISFALASRIWPQSQVVAVGNYAFDVWGIGFLAMVGFGFYARVRHSSSR